jgi:hypothetical protein
MSTVKIDFLHLHSRSVVLAAERLTNRGHILEGRLGLLPVPGVLLGPLLLFPGPLLLPLALPLGRLVPVPHLLQGLAVSSPCSVMILSAWATSLFVGRGAVESQSSYQDLTRSTASARRITSPSTPGPRGYVLCVGGCRVRGFGFSLVFKHKTKSKPPHDRPRHIHSYRPRHPHATPNSDFSQTDHLILFLVYLVSSRRYQKYQSDCGDSTCTKGMYQTCTKGMYQTCTKTARGERRHDRPDRCTIRWWRRWWRWWRRWWGWCGECDRGGRTWWRRRTIWLVVAVAAGRVSTGATPGPVVPVVSAW